MKLTEQKLREIIREEFNSLNEGKAKKWVKQVADETGYECEEFEGGVMIPEGPAANSNHDGNMVWGWAPGDTAWIESADSFGALYYEEDIDNIDDFIDIVNNPYDTEGKWS